MPHTILYVEDDSATVELVRDVLYHRDIHFISAASADEGLELAYAEPVDLLLLDIMMPGEDGWTVYDRLRADEAYRDLPIILLTALLHKYRVVKKFETSPVDAYITKPFDAGTLRRTIEEMLAVRLWSEPAPSVDA
jgi:putative two-component system response regulator